jgi:hypothetical protein
MPIPQSTMPCGASDSQSNRRAFLRLAAAATLGLMTARMMSASFSSGSGTAPAGYSLCILSSRGQVRPSEARLYTRICASSIATISRRSPPAPDLHFLARQL